MDIPVGFVAIDPRSPFVEHVGPVFRHADDPCRYGMRLRAHHGNRQGDGHGGLIFTFADFIIPAALRHGDDGAIWLTVNLGADYFAAARLGSGSKGRWTFFGRATASASPPAT